MFPILGLHQSYACATAAGQSSEMAGTHLLLAADVAAHRLSVNALLEQALHSPAAGGSPTVREGPLQLQVHYWQDDHRALGPLATALHAAQPAHNIWCIYGARCGCWLPNQQI